jgi:hypothetical protein
MECKWIPVSERLPEVGDFVICSQINRDVGEGTLLPDGRWHILFESCEYEAGWVTAWMPLPELYREDGV